jgi:ABC-type transport system involved in multi-copper enzyme maturation permease subunit
MEQARSGPLLPGLSQLFRKEVLESRRSKRAIAFVVIMTGILLLVPIIGYYQLDHIGGGFRRSLSDEDMEAVVSSWAGILAYIGSLMVIASTVDSMTHERALGITAWIVTKPVSRLSYLLAKAAGHATVAGITVVVIPTAIWLVVMTVLFEDVPYIYVAWAVVIMLVEVIFLSFCVVALGVPLRAVVWIALVALGLWFIPTAVPAISALEWTYRILPSYLPIAVILASSEEYATTSEVFTLTVAALATAAVVFLGASLLFERQEL